MSPTLRCRVVGWSWNAARVRQLAWEEFKLCMGVSVLCRMRAALVGSLMTNLCWEGMLFLVFCSFVTVQSPSWVSSFGSSLARLLYPAKDRKSTLSLISSSAVPLYPLWSRAPFRLHFHRACRLRGAESAACQKSEISEVVRQSIGIHAVWVWDVLGFIWEWQPEDRLDNSYLV